MDNSYKIALIGGTGKVGRYIASRALQNGYQIRMLVRNPEKLTLRDNRIEMVVGNARNLEDIQTLLKGCQIVINAFGQPNKEEPIYSSVTKNILEVMNDFQIDRYIGVTGGSLTLNGDKKSFINKVGAKLFEIIFAKMMIDKKKEWHILNNYKSVKWTLIRLPFIDDGKEIGYIKESLIDMPGTKITSRDIATFIINQIKNPMYINKAPFISN